MAIAAAFIQNQFVTSLSKQSISPPHKKQVYFRTPTDRGMLKGVRLTCQASSFRILCRKRNIALKSTSSSMAASKDAESRTADPSSATSEASRRVTRKDQLDLAKEDVKKLISEKFCHPIIVRLAWHDSGTYDKVDSSLVKSFITKWLLYCRRQ